MIIMTNQGLRSQQYYRIVANMGITDILQLIFNGMFAGIFTYTCVDFTKSDLKLYVNKVVSGVMNFNWVIYCFFAHLLAFNRFCHILLQNRINSIFSRRNTNVMLSMVWLYGLCWLAAYLIPNFNLFYYVGEYKWDYGKMPLSRKAWLLELISDMIHVTGMLIWYTCILVKLRIKGFLSATAADPSLANIRKSQIQNKQLTTQDKKERGVLWQAILICLLTTLALIGFFLVPSIVENRWANLISNCLWLGCAGNNGIIHIMLNSTINRKFRELAYHGKNFSVGRVVPIKVSMAVQHCSTILTKNKETVEKRERLAVHIPIFICL
uniref:Uncharacterized protein n=1 Tax=Romanomermis culicivorax TaxID=13658 RepID=A0A915IT46_ROMCU